jgi:hypothetical protein
MMLTNRNPLVKKLKMQSATLADFEQVQQQPNWQFPNAGFQGMIYVGL